MKKLIVPLILSTLSLCSFAKYSGGIGEPNNPYLIATSEDLNAIGNNKDDWSKHFLMTDDINMADYFYTDALIAPHKNNQVFTGTFNGNNYTISSLTIVGKNYVGLFGKLDKGAEIINLNIIDVNIIGNIHVGSICGANYYYGFINNCYSNGSVKGDAAVGGICGTNLRGIIYNSFTTGSVAGNDAVGGLCGQSNVGIIIDSYSKASVSGDSALGGLCGNIQHGGFINNCYAEGPINGESSLGGLCGNNYRGTISNCYSTGSVTGDKIVGGLCGYNGGYNNSGSIRHCYSTSPVSGNSEVGGLCGLNGNIVLNSFWDIEASGISTSDGGVGKTTSEMQKKSTFTDVGWDFVGEIENGVSSFWTMEQNNYPELSVFDDNFIAYRFKGQGTKSNPYRISNPNDLGAIWQKPLCHYVLINDINLADIKWSIAVIPFFGGSFKGNNNIISNLNISGGCHLGLFGLFSRYGMITELGLENIDIIGDDLLGGLCGRNYKSSIINCYVTGSINGDDHLGGICGNNSRGTIGNCGSAVYVSGSSNNGSLCGTNYYGTISNCYATGPVFGTYSIGGLCGRNYFGKIDNCYSTSAITGYYDGAGGLVGDNFYGTIYNCYSTGSVKGNYNVGGLCGENHRNYPIVNCFWDTETSGIENSAGGKGKTTAEMQTQSTFVNAGWDFNTPIWKFCSLPDYPKLDWEWCAGPVEMLVELGEMVEELGLGEGVENSLLAKLEAGIGALEDDNEKNDGAAVNILGAFINAASAQSGKKIPESQADALIAEAVAIIEAL